MTGAFAAVSRSDRRRTDATVAITGGPAATILSWRIRRDTCAAPGEVVGAAVSYPDLETSASGSADAAAVLSQAIVSGRNYVLEIRRTGENFLVVCAHLSPR